ncbi:HK97 gp10 family phage protein [Nonomuraea sp. NPDC050328]|uniref:HK97 gp10 family phage protein n=1 Tax=Nonomuraea sp. NPDC050328 TaxID=3364361 RepID=UPI0037BA8880
MPQKSDLTLNIGDLDQAVHDAAAKGLKKALEHLLQKSREQVPHEEGTLERSGTVVVDEGELVGAVSYDTPYAIIQHEDLTLKHDEGRKAKYLEDPADEERGAMLEIIAAEMRRAMG